VGKGSSSALLMPIQLYLYFAQMGGVQITKRLLSVVRICVTLDSIGITRDCILKLKDRGQNVNKMCVCVQLLVARRTYKGV